MKESENINNLREIKREFRKNNLDNSLLFLCSILGIIFGFLEVYIGGPQSILYFFPIFILGLILPFLHGYLLGSVFKDSSIERVRGWLFLEAGLLIYGANLISTIINEFYPGKHYLKIIPDMIFFTIVIYIIPKISLITFENIFDLCGDVISDLDIEIMRLSSNVSRFFAMCLIFLVIPLEKGDLSEIFIRLALASIMLLLGLDDYKRSYYFQRKENHKYKVSYEEGNKLIATISSIMSIITIMIFLIITEVNIGLSEILERNIKIGIIMLIGVLNILYVIFREKRDIVFLDT